MRRALIIAAAVGFLAAPAPAGEPLEGAARVRDGDTLVVGGVPVRMRGADAFESAQICTLVFPEAPGRRASWPCGAAATEGLAALIGDQSVTCWPTGTDRYRRFVADCRAAGADLGAELVRQGLALAYRKYDDRYVLDELEAWMWARGAWRGRFVEPWRWRKGAR